jgi:ATP-binding cassette subfamily B protein RaxB
MMTKKLGDKNPVHLLSFISGNRLPVILQTEMAECGLACIAMVASFHGYKLELNALRRDYPASLKGATLKSLIDTSHHLNFSCRALRLELADVVKLQTPCILHWDLNHFVVLKKATKEKITIHDPARGELTLSLEEVSHHFTGVALELIPTHAFEKKAPEPNLKLSSLWQKITGLRRSLFQVFFLSLLMQIFVLVTPFYMQLVVDHVVVGNDTDLLLVLALGFLLLAFIRVGSEILRSFIVMYLGSQLSIQMAANLFRHLLHLPLSFFEKRHIGDVISRFGSMDNIKQLLTTGLIETLVDGIMAIGTLIMMFIYSPKLAFIVLFVVSLYASLRFLMYQPFRRLTEESIVANAKENSNFMETVRAAQSIKIFGRESQRQTVWHNHYADAMNADIRINKLRITYNGLNEFLYGVENVIVIYFAATLVLSNSLTVGMLFAFMAYKLQFTQKAAAVIEKMIEFRMLGLHLSRIADIAMTTQEDLDKPFSISMEKDIKGELTLNKVGFQYALSEPWVYQNINFTFKAGQSIAVVGPSGCGKTTLIKNMLGLLEPTKGKILIDGVDIYKFGLVQYRSLLGAVMQDDQLLSGSMLDNITFFDGEMNEDLAIESAKIACIHQDIINMPMAYNTLIGDMGTTLSGGQRQRLLLARALYRQPKLLFMDEATSNLDTELEAIVNEGIKKLNITRIIIAHRPETIRSADRVLALQAGALVEVA